MAYCPKCGNQVGEASNFCKKCGYNLKDEQLGRTQPGAKNQPPKCAIHPMRDSIGVCSVCGNAVCDLCRTVAEGKLICPSCISKTSQKTADKIEKSSREVLTRQAVEGVASEGKVASRTTSTISALAPMGWNWGAFFLGWIWGICNRVYISLIALIPLPFLGLIMAFVLGAYGSQWAWEKKSWDGAEHFRRIQKKWAWWGFGVFVGCLMLPIIAGIIVMAVGGVYGVPKQKAYDTILPQIQNAVTAYFVNHNGLFPPCEGTITVKLGSYGYEVDCHIFDICSIVDNEMLLRVPDGCYGDAGETNTNFYLGWCDNPTNGHYIWVVDDNGNLYSICDENRDGYYSSTDRVSGFHQDIWP